MELNAWIEGTAGVSTGHRLGRRVAEAAAKLLREKPRTVYAWYRRERPPCFRSALNIVVTSSGKVDYNGIYGPFGKAAVSVKIAELGDELG